MSEEQLPLVQPVPGDTEATQPEAVSLDAKIACLAREVALRRHAYPRFVAKKQMTAAKASQELHVMECILRDYEAMRAAIASAS